jgi:hypothetical protein
MSVSALAVPSETARAQSSSVAAKCFTLANIVVASSSGLKSIDHQVLDSKRFSSSINNVCLPVAFKRALLGDPAVHANK